MKRLFAVLVLVSACFASRTGKAEEALLWCFNDPKITGSNEQTYQAKDVTGPGGEKINAIRMKAVDGDTSSYLQLYASNGSEFISLGDALAMPSEGEDGWVLEPLYAGLGESYAREGVQFMVELGAYRNVDDWTVLAYGTLADYSALLSEHIQQMSATAAPAGSAWDGGAYSIPEPSGAMLLLLGGALLSLRRKRHV
ncbi:MAG: PEP-CTERM sorting domain-containing protein [Kiritimatiellae bacterium]|nr:PEP-CTERM sorting domain-containing protein [Kiritimatiellia bacterium]